MRLQLVEIGLHGLGAGQHDQVAGRNRSTGADPSKVHLRVQAQRIGSLWFEQRGYATATAFSFASRLSNAWRIGGNGVFGIEHQPVQVGHAEDTLPVRRLEPVEARIAGARCRRGNG